MAKSTKQRAPVTGELATVPQVAAFLAVSRSKIYLMMDCGDLAYVKLGKSRRIPWNRVHGLVAENMVGSR